MPAVVAEADTAQADGIAVEQAAVVGQPMDL